MQIEIQNVEMVEKQLKFNLMAIEYGMEMETLFLKPNILVSACLNFYIFLVLTLLCHVSRGLGF